MPLTCLQLPLKIIANMAAADTYCTAAVKGACFAAWVSFQWQPAIFPPDKNVNSAASPLLPA